MQFDAHRCRLLAVVAVLDYSQCARYIKSSFTMYYLKDELSQDTFIVCTHLLRGHVADISMNDCVCLCVTAADGHLIVEFKSCLYKVIHSNIYL